MRPLSSCISILLLAGCCFAVPKTHTIVLGKWRTVEIHTEAATGQPTKAQQVTSQQVITQQTNAQQINAQQTNARQIKVRELIIDGRTREYTTGATHEITDHIFVVRRAYRINDALPEETKKSQWIWRLGGWISVDRQTAHVAQLNLPAFDGDISEASWYRDYAAYCGASDDGSKTYLIVSQLGKRKPILKKEYSGAACAVPQWERTPSRVAFLVAGEKTIFIVHEHSADLQPDITPDTTESEEGPQ
jgi:hypothetical protein